MHQSFEEVAAPADRPLLPNEPRVLDWARADALTQRFLTSALPDLEALFQHVRASIDAELRGAQPAKLGKPYPLGQCLEISFAVKNRLQQLRHATLTGAPARGYAALAAFLTHGGTMRQVWGDLRGEFFQNAFLVGTLYIDVANDTVVPTKPPVEILPFAESRLTAIQDFHHFARLASRYWRARVFPNHVLPALAPYFPLITATPGGSVRLHSDSNYMVALTQADGFRPGEAVLDAGKMQSDVFQLFADRFASSSLQSASGPEEGRVAALKFCQKYRSDSRHQTDEHRHKIIKAAQEANNCLARLRVGTASA